MVMIFIMPLDAKIEAVLFYRAEEVPIAELSRLLSVSDEDIQAGLDQLALRLEGKGVCLIRTSDRAVLATAPEAADIIGGAADDELTRELGKAALETLAILLYRGPSTRMEIDYIRGVNTQSILRTLAIRGLIEKQEAPGAGRAASYAPTTALLAHFGVTRAADLPSFDDFKKELETFERSV